jgi:hypothetical protein
VPIRRFARAGALALALALGGVGIAGAVVVQQGGLRITVLSQIKPFQLPREGTAPIAVFVAGHVATTNGAVPPQLQQMSVKVNRHGLLQSKGLAVCEIPQIQPASTERALQSCPDAVIGSGQFWAHIVLPGQDPYPTRGRLLIFNGREKGRPVLLAHIFTSNPFFSSFVITFSIKKISNGPYGTELTASLPQALGSWGFVDRIKLTLRRKYQYLGKQRSYFNAGCPAPAGTRLTSFRLAEATLSFEAGRELSATVTKACRVKG